MFSIHTAVQRFIAVTKLVVKSSQNQDWFYSEAKIHKDIFVPWLSLLQLDSGWQYKTVYKMNGFVGALDVSILIHPLTTLWIMVGLFDALAPPCWCVFLCVERKFP